MNKSRFQFRQKKTRKLMPPHVPNVKPIAPPGVGCKRGIVGCAHELDFTEVPPRKGMRPTKANLKRARSRY